LTELLNKITQGDCLEVMKAIPDSSVDLILCDPPYGTMKNAGLDGWSNQTTDWDETLNTEELFKQYERVLRENGNLILFSQEPYTSRLRTYKAFNLEFAYPLLWKKDHFANALISKKAPVNYFEDISVFYKKYDWSMSNPLRNYSKQVFDHIGLGLKRINSVLGHRKAEHFFYWNTSQFKICTKPVYEEITRVFNLPNLDFYITYDELTKVNSKFTRVFNLQGQKTKSNIFEYKKDYQGLHPTQKPVALFEDIIRTYSNEGEVILDNCIGSGTTAVACINTGRSFIGIERETEYVEIANKRIQDAIEKKGGNA
jgi:site-specific DNA-methyltransferase (adenine-specific)